MPLDGEVILGVKNFAKGAYTGRGGGWGNFFAPCGVDLREESEFVCN